MSTLRYPMLCWQLSDELVGGTIPDASLSLIRSDVRKLKAAMAKKKKPIDEDDEKVRLSKILEKVGVREVIREELSVQLLLWKHDEDLVLAEQK